MLMHTCRGEGHTYSLGYHKDTHLCLTLKCATSVYIFNLFSCYNCPVEGFDLISELLSWAMGPSLHLFWLHEGKVAGSLPSAFTARIETPMVPAHTLPEFHMAPHLKGAVKGQQQHVLYTLELTFTGTVPSWHLPGRSLCMGMNSAAWVGSSPVKSLTVGGVRGNMFREEIYDICMTLITQTSDQDSF